MTDTDKSLFGARIGDRVLLREGHPWAGYTGRVVAFEQRGQWIDIDIELDGGLGHIEGVDGNDIKVIEHG